MDTEGKLFVWRGKIEWGGQNDYSGGERTHYGPMVLPDVYHNRYKFCPFCKVPYANSENRTSRNCQICGFSCSEETGDFYGEGSNVDYWSGELSTIKHFNISSSEITFPELASHLKRKHEDYYNLSPRRFEELIADVYRNLGYEVELTQQTCDGGIDIILLNNRREQEIIQCKRYAQTRTVSVSAVREILGVMIYKGIDRASIVTTSSFSKPAISFKDGVKENINSLKIDLLDASTLVESVGAYNMNLPPLHLNPTLEKLQQLQDVMDK